MRILDMAIQHAQTARSSLESTLYPKHCLLTGERLVQDPFYAPGISDTALLFHQPAPRPVEIDLLIQKHMGADDLMITRFDALWSLSATSTIGNAIHAIKYDGRTDLAVALGRLLGDHCHRSNADPQSIVCPVPIHLARRRERGYNQSELIAFGVCERMGIGLLDRKAIVRTRYTRSQTTKSAADRLSNVHGAFTVKQPELIHNARILLIDDVLTTGSTLNACATALVEAGARRVDVATLCVAV